MPSPLSRIGDRTSRVASRVSTIELLFDLVFVFTISQVASIVVHDPTWPGVARAALILGLVWWMYDAFAWLTNQTTPDTAPVRVWLIGAMAAFLVMALAIPEAFGETGVLFGAAYIVVAIIHASLFVARGGSGAARRMLAVGTSNVLVGVLLVCSGFVEGPIDWVLFALPFLAFLASALQSIRGGFDPGAAHMVERHGLLMIIAFGESIVAVGIVASEHALDVAVIAGTVLSVATVAALWWCYFTGDDLRAERTLEQADARTGTRLALVAFYLEHLAMIFGLVLLAAGLHEVLEHAAEPASATAAVLVSGGVALYLLADAAYRRTLALGPIAWRLSAALLVALAAFAGIAQSGLLQLALIVLVVGGALAIEARTSRRRGATAAAAPA
ncbi:Low temperature requirement protein LtrA [Agromyces sp. CF514]|uniref:low temperature requirement protein A n=1 Tax=Agromyces sp. CF514 TaxID=1881031 RepID=UPI0008E10D4B|nr:low temperature requirement protein A [Agromyces sp. CF514]SFR73977.1 Low temperature requirement protein LtrA [Agromyces sp. CF514]